MLVVSLTRWKDKMMGAFSSNLQICKLSHSTCWDQHFRTERTTTSFEGKISRQVYCRNRAARGFLIDSAIPKNVCASWTYIRAKQRRVKRIPTTAADDSSPYLKLVCIRKVVPADPPAQLLECRPRFWPSYAEIRHSNLPQTTRRATTGIF